MKLFFSGASPYVRKVSASAIVLGLTGQIERLASAANPINRDKTILPHNPLGKVPTLVTDDGMALYDSRVICEYLDSLAGGSKVFPAAGKPRFQALVEQAAADGLLDAALLCRYEVSMRAEDKRVPAWTAGQMEKIASTLTQFEAWVDGFGARMDIGTISVGCALGYLDLRFADYDWRAAHPKLATWFASFEKLPPMAETMPKA